MAAGECKFPRILIVDDDEAYLASMRRTLRGQYDVVTTKDPMQAIKIFELQGPFAVVISDYLMPFINGIELFSRIIAINDQVQRIILTGHADLHMAIDAVNRGKITAFLTKPTPAMSIRTVVADAVRAYNQAILKNSRSQTGQQAEPFPWDAGHGPYTRLTVKEAEILSLLAKGYSTEEISLNLYITVGTVKSHVNNLFGKLDVNSRAKLVARGMKLGLIKA